MKKLLVFLALSLAANAALLVTYFVRSSRAGPVANGWTASANASGARDAADTGLSAADASALKRSGELMMTGDLRTLVARLRAAGFPGSVIRGIITAQLADQFGARRKAAVAHQQEIPFWRTSVGSFPYDPKAGGEITRLEREQKQALRDLLGPDAAPSDDWSRLMQERKYGSLSQEKIDQLQDIISDYSDLRNQFSIEARGIFLPEDQAKFQLLQKEQRADIVKLFTPDELAEYDMRTSNLGARLRFQLNGFEASQDEFRTIFQLTEAMEAKNGSNEFGAAVNVPGTDRMAAQKQLQADIAAALGPDRYADYQQSTNPQFQSVDRLLLRFDLPTTLAPQVLAVQQDIEQRANVVRQDKTLSQDDRNTQLAGLAQEAQSKLSTALGSAAYEAYKSSSGGWVNNLTPQTLRVFSSGNPSFPGKK